MKINEAFFDEWNEASAYVAGVIWASGSMVGKEGKERIQLSSSKREDIERIHTLMQSTYAITESKGSGENLRFFTSFGSKQLMARLKDSGYVKRNRNEGELPIGMPDEMIPHFMRGYFDQSGYFTYEKVDDVRRRMKSGMFFGNNLLRRDFMHELKGRGIRGGSLVTHKKRPSSYGESLEIRLYARDTRRLYEILYSNATIYDVEKKKYYDRRIDRG